MFGKYLIVSSEKSPECRAVARLAVCFDMSVMSFDDLSCDCKSKTGAIFLQGNKGIENIIFFATLKAKSFVSFIIFGTYMLVTHTYDITGKVKTLARNRKLVQKNKQ